MGIRYFGGGQVRFIWKRPLFSLAAACLASWGPATLSFKNSPPDCFYPPAAGTVAFKSLALFFAKKIKHLNGCFIFGGGQGI